MAIYKSAYTRQISKVTPEQRLSNQVILTGTDEKFIVTGGAFYLEYLDMVSASVVISDGDSNVVATITDSPFGQDHSPLRCDQGIRISGTINMAKGFFVAGSIYGLGG